MRVISLFVSALLFLSPHPQQTEVTSAQGSLLLQQSLAALSPNLTLTDVTLSGSVRRIAGSDDQSGSAIFKALSSGAARTDLSFSSGTLSEVVNSSSAAPVGAWYGSDGVSHPIAFHNLLSESAWFFPVFAISHRLSVGYVVTDIGPETYNGQQVEHIFVSQPSLSQLTSDVSQQHLSQVDFYLDMKTLFPAAIAFYVHPDNNAFLDIPVEIRFADYRVVNGVQVPFHIQKFLNNSLMLDFEVQNVTTNSGISASEFAIQ